MGRAAALTALVVGALAVVAIVAFAPGSDGRTVRAAFGSATNLISGVEVRLAGRKVGEVESVEYVDGQAIVELRIDDERIWPLRRGTAARIRYGGTVSVAGRYVSLEPGPPSAPAIPRDGLLTRADTLTPVEFDEVFDLYDRDTRGHIKHLLGNSAHALGRRGRALGRGLEDAPDGLDTAADLLAELGADPRALETLVITGDRTARAVASRDANLRDLLATAAETFDEFAARAEPIRFSLDRLPRTLRATRGTLARTDQSLAILDGLVADLGPGARRLRHFARPARRVLVTLEEVAPLASETFARGARAAPEIERFLSRGTRLMPRLQSVFDQAAPAFACMRPYAPEVAGFLSTWAAYSKNYDARDHYFRTLINNPPFGAGTAARPEDVVGEIPGITYAFPRPPGMNARQPWLQPACGAGPEVLDPKQDPEADG